MTEEARLAVMLYHCIRETIDGVVFFVTRGKLIGLAPPGTWKDDCIVIVNGSVYPFVVRPVPGTKFFGMIGPCYVQGLMQGMRYDGEDMESLTFI